MLDFRMESFLAVCRHMNYTKAASELHITQPAVSQNIRYLENEYHAKLFDYTGKHLILTQAGHILLDAAATIRHDDLILKEKLQELRRSTKIVSFGATHTIGEFMIVDKLAQYLRENQEVLLRLEIADTEQLLQEINDGKIDFAIVEGFFEQKQYETMLFSKEPLIAVCGPEFDVPDEVELTDLLLKRLCVRERGSGSRDILERTLAEYSLSLEDFPYRAEIGSPQTIKALVHCNAGFSFSYEKSVRDELAAGTLRKIHIRNFTAEHSFTFLWRKGSMYGNTFRGMFEALKD